MSSQNSKSLREYGKRRHCPQHHPHVTTASIAGPSTSGTNTQVSLPVTADLASLFECPVCFDYVLPPILQCPSGHLVCSSCRPKLSCCPTCRGPLAVLLSGPGILLHMHRMSRRYSSRSLEQQQRQQEEESSESCSNGEHSSTSSGSSVVRRKERRSTSKRPRRTVVTKRDQRVGTHEEAGCSPPPPAQGNIRNLAMEKVASSVMFLCKYSTSGCTASLLHTEKPEHEEVCEYRPYSCPCPGASCKWQGSLDQVMPHLLISHKSITTLQGEDIVFLVTDINLPGAVDWVMMQSCFGHHFMLVLEKQEKFPGHQQFFAIVQLIGSRKQAEIFAYRLELNGHRRRLTWEATPRSIHEGIASAILSSDCLVFDTSIVQLFEDNGNLGINVTISMVRESDKSRDSW